MSSRFSITNFVYVAAAILMIVLAGYITLYAYHSGFLGKIQKTEFVSSVPPGMSKSASNDMTEKKRKISSPDEVHVEPEVHEELPMVFSVHVLDIDRLMAISRPGMIITNYINEYQKVMDDGIKKLDEAAVNAEKNKNLGLFAALKHDRQYLVLQKDKVADSAKKYLRDIVMQNLRAEPLPLNIILIDANSAYTPPTAASDFTDEMIKRLAIITPTLPALPKLTIPNASSSPSAAPSASKAPASKNNSVKKKK